MTFPIFHSTIAPVYMAQNIASNISEDSKVCDEIDDKSWWQILIIITTVESNTNSLKQGKCILGSLCKALY